LELFMPKGRILVVEDDAAIRTALCDCLRFAGFESSGAPDGEAGLKLALQLQPDLLLLDLLMPKLDGLSVLREVRRTRPTLPVIILTAKGEEADKVKGLRDGADDYVVKPFSASELLARVEAVLRRSAERPSPVPRFTIAGIEVDFSRREVRHASGQSEQLSEKEAAVLEYLAMHRGRVVHREELLRSVWGLDPRGMQTRTVDMAIARLRELLHDDAKEPKVIQTVRAKGYMLAGDGEKANTLA
jgi:two-component system, OmpR family, alkaline phosphatase synthesis response regulator PhoP